MICGSAGIDLFGRADHVPNRLPGSDEPTGFSAAAPAEYMFVVDPKITGRLDLATALLPASADEAIG